MGYKGFQTVEAKPNKRDKTKERSEEHLSELSPTAAAFRTQPQAKTPAQAEKSKRLPGENPIDPKQVKADLKAARSIQKVYASQTAPKQSNANTAATASSASSAQQQSMGAWGSGSAAAAKPAVSSNTTASSISLPSGGGGGWGGKNNGLRGASILHETAAFADLPSAGEFVADVRHTGGPRSAPAAHHTSDATALWEQTMGKANNNKNKNKNNNKKADAAPAQPTHTAHTLVLGKKVTPKPSAAVTDEVEAEEVVAPVAEGGAALPISVAPIMLTADGKNKEINLNGSLDKMAAKCEQFISGMPKNSTAVAALPIRGGLFMTVAGKKFSENSTVFEPWMVESYFKALTTLLSGEAESAVAHPYYQHGPNGSQTVPDDAVEASVGMKVIKAKAEDGLLAPTTLIELEHTGAHNNKAQVKKVRVSLKSFATGMARAGEAFVNFRETLEDVLEASPLKGAAGGEITKKFAGKLNNSVALFKAALEKASA